MVVLVESVFLIEIIEVLLILLSGLFNFKDLNYFGLSNETSDFVLKSLSYNKPNLIISGLVSFSFTYDDLSLSLT